MENLLCDINQVIDHGQSWTEGRNNEDNFYQINQFLTKETSRCIKDCQSITQRRQHFCEVSTSLNEITEITTTSAKADQTDYKKLMANIEQVNKKLQSICSKTEENSASVNKQSHNIALKLEQIETQASEMIEKHENGYEILKDLQLQIDTIRNEIYQQDPKIDLLSDEVQDSKKKVNSTNQLLEKLKQSVEQKVNDQNTLIKEIEDKVYQLQESDQSINGLKFRVEHLSSKIIVCEKKISHFSSQEKSIKEYQELLQRIEQVNECVTSIQESSSNKEDHHTLLSKESEDIVKKFLYLEQKCVNNEVKLSECFDELTNASNFMLRLRTEIEDVKNQTIENETNINSCFEKVNENERKIVTASSSIDNLDQTLQQKLNDHEALIRNMEEILKDAINGLELDNKLKIIRRKIIKLKTEVEENRKNIERIEGYFD